MSDNEYKNLILEDKYFIQYNTTRSNINSFNIISEDTFFKSVLFFLVENSYEYNLLTVDDNDHFYLNEENLQIIEVICYENIILIIKEANNKLNNNSYDYNDFKIVMKYIQERSTNFYFPYMYKDIKELKEGN